MSKRGSQKWNKEDTAMLIDLIEKNTAIWDTKSNDIHLLHKKLHRVQRNAKSLHAAYYKIKSRDFLKLPFVYLCGI